MSEQIRLVYEDGTHQVLPIGQAQSEASQAKRDLIPTALHQDPPVYKMGLKDQIAIAEYKRQKERRKQEMEQRRRLVVKEVCRAVHWNMALPRQARSLKFSLASMLMTASLCWLTLHGCGLSQSANKTAIASDG